MKVKNKEIYLAGGCFWGVQAYFDKIKGILETNVGYANGNSENPSYEDVIYNNTGHAETVHVRYDSDKISLEKILDYFFRIIDPTSINKQGNDRGNQYRTGIYYLHEEDGEIVHEFINSEQKKYEKRIVTEVEEIRNYYPAEEYHQKYLEKNPNGYCHIDLEVFKE